MFRDSCRWMVLASLWLGCGSFTGPPRVFAEEPVTLWSFLGIPQAMKHLHTATFNRFGKHPGLEPKPPLRALADPANLTAGAASSPAQAAAPASSVTAASLRTVAAEEPPPADPALAAVRKAAEIKQAEDMTPQKVKALRYLGKVGCGRPGVQEALMNSMDVEKEPVEEVRYAAVQAIMEATGDQCDRCNADTCCKEELLKRMAELAFGRDNHGCWLEPSDRVREAFQEALQKCCPGGLPIIEVPGPEPEPAGDRPEGDDPTGGNPAPSRSGDSLPGPAPTEAGAPPEPQALHSQDSQAETGLSYKVSIETAGLSRPGNSPTTRQVALATVRGTVLRVEPADNTVAIRCPDEGRAVEGTFVTVRRGFLTGTETVGTLKVIRAEEGHVIAEPQHLKRPLRSGDDVVLFMQNP